MSVAPVDAALDAFAEVAPACGPYVSCTDPRATTLVAMAGHRGGHAPRAAGGAAAPVNVLDASKGTIGGGVLFVGRG